MRKGQKKPVEIMRLARGEIVEQSHIDAVVLSLKLHQTVTAKIGLMDEGDSALILEARQ